MYRILIGVVLHDEITGYLLFERGFRLCQIGRMKVLDWRNKKPTDYGGSNCRSCMRMKSLERNQHRNSVLWMGIGNRGENATIKNTAKENK